jgi:hypothetical protein
MTSPPFFEGIEFSYENVYVKCPSCLQPIIFNRVSDLHEQGHISGMDVCCLRPECRHPFRIGGDIVNPRHQLLLYDCDRLLAEKRFTACVLYAAQSFEVFCSLYLTVELAFKPYARECQGKGTECVPWRGLNEVLELLYKTTRSFTFVPLRNVFLHRVLTEQPLSSLAAAREAIQKPPGLRRSCPSNAAIAKHSDQHVAALLRAFKDSSVHELRNRVVHQVLYRPSRDEAETAVRGAGDILYPLGARLQLFTDDVNWHLRHA